ncbi:arginine--tRNA ligase [Parasutterella secunda]|jgi:arginine--tRNA ligase|uniref:arginine--tRNA ligase n=1 Tax=Parasutterella secunda TaxID=626947 RepID=UPI0021ABC79B|nr:arginine--tRNA ligase [Parasutterella secunda]MCR8920187.1 arginine--tRNA ligase [Parasutterella secunda]MDM8087502.1 arginine--tRNA ligase [Parasutterella secunda]
MLNEQKNAILSLFNDALVSMGVDNAQILLERPKVAAHGDLACNVAMQLARQLKKNPRAIATELIERIQSLPQSKELIESFEIAGPGFINMRLSQQAKTFAIREVLRLGSDFGKNKDHAGESILIEYVSANPTGPLHLGHARQGALGDVLSNLMRTQGWNVCREFYYNDAGVQIQTLTESVRLRIKELLGETITFPENGYQGLYIKDIAKDFLDKKTIRTRDGQEITASGNVEDVDSIRAFSVGYLKNEQDSDLNALGVSFDNFYLESSLYSDGLVERAVNALIASGHTYEQDGALWLRTTDFKEFGDDKDRVMRKQDGHYTYFVPDVAYHLSKFERGFVKAVDIQGSDHHGTTARVRIGVQVAGQQLGLNVPKVFPVYVLHKMLKVIKNGEEVKMSKRSGTYVTLRDLVNWVGKDAARFFLVSRKADSEFVFDIDLALSQSDENPVYYLQYAHARICSVFAQAKEKGFSIPTQEAIAEMDLSALSDKNAQALIARISEFPETLSVAAKECAPHTLCFYLKDLAGDFHAFYNAERVLVEDEAVRNARLALLLAARQVLRNGLDLLGVSAPEKM